MIGAGPLKQSLFNGLVFAFRGCRVMVLERGKLVEYASPLELLNDPNSLFYALCKKTGSLEELKATARAEQDAKLAGGSTDSG